MEKINNVERLIANNPIYSKYEGFCNVCKTSYSPGELISPFFEYGKNYWRHTACLQLFYLNLRYSGTCNDCETQLPEGDPAYWSKHNGRWCVQCIEPKFPKMVVSFSRPLEDYIEKIVEAS